MSKVTLNIRILTPIWTGDISKRSTELKMSGLIGGMRQAFEMLVRKHGGHTCNITGDAGQRCNYEQDRNICPACAIFGCTGLSRSFRLNLELETRYPVVPERDPQYPNRNSRNTPYNAPCYIGKWLAVCAGHPNDMRNIQPAEATAYLRDNVRVAYSPNVSEISFVPLNSFLPSKGIELEFLLRHLFFFMSKYSGLGAKVRQGWGTFELVDRDGQENMADVGMQEMDKLISRFRIEHMEWDEGFPSASNCFAAEWTLGSDNLGFTWPQNANLTDRSYRETGFAMTYRLRRHVKFYEIDGGTGVPVDTAWRGLAASLTPPWSYVPWKEILPFVRAVFGRDNADEDKKSSGLVGFSHLYQKNNSWRLRFFGRIPAQYLDRETGSSIAWHPDAAVVRDFFLKRISSMVHVSSYSLMDGGNI